MLQQRNKCGNIHVPKRPHGLDRFLCVDVIVGGLICGECIYEYVNVYCECILVLAVHRPFENVCLLVYFVLLRSLSLH